MTDNLKLWNAVSRVPKEHLKPFNNGKFSGTAIKPMYFIKAMTEHFGVCGQGWFIDKPEFQLVEAGESKLVYSTVAVWVQGGQRVYGIGGDWAVRNGKGEDEAFKKAYTDALTNALVKLGVGADIHMGLWDGNKYVDEDPPANNDAPKQTAPKATPQTTVGTDAKVLKAEEARKLYTQLVAELRELKTDAGIEKWKADSKSRIDQLGSWASHINNAINDHVAFLLNGKAA